MPHPADPPTPCWGMSADVIFCLLFAAVGAVRTSARWPVKTRVLPPNVGAAVTLKDVK